MNNHIETTGNIGEFLPMVPARAMSASSQKRATFAAAQGRERVKERATMKHSLAASFFLALYLAAYLGGGFAIIGGIAKIFHTSAW